MNQRVKAVPEVYRCETCQGQRVVIRQRGKTREMGHSKTMFCPGCKRKRAFARVE